MFMTQMKRWGLAGIAALTFSATALSSPVAAGGGNTRAAEQRGDRTAIENTESPLAIAPSCVMRWYHNHGGHKHVHLYNGCSGTRYVKVIVAYGPDSGCKGLSRGASGTHSWSYGWPFSASRFDRLETC